MSIVATMNDDAASLMDGARAWGFDKCMYLVEVLDGETDQPLEAIGTGLTAEYMNNFFKRVTQDPLRRMVARGEIPVGTTPVTYENTGSSLSIAPGRHISTGDAALLRWCLSQGIRTGVGFRINMSHGRLATLNFYSEATFDACDLDAASQALFLVGHRIHATLEPHLRLRRGNILSGRESECLEWIARGVGNRQIAQMLGLSLDTIKEHVQNLYRKLQVNSRAEAVARGYMLALLS